MADLTSVRLLPLDREIIEHRITSADFELERTLGGRPVRLRFGPEFPGDALDLYPALLDSVGAIGTVPGTYIVVTPDGDVVGQVGTVGEPVAGEVEIGYGINTSCRGRGVASVAVALLLDALRESGRVERVRATCDPGNVASARVLARNGFAQVGQDVAEGSLLVWTRSLG